MGPGVTHKLQGVLLNADYESSTAISRITLMACLYVVMSVTLLQHEWGCFVPGRGGVAGSTMCGAWLCELPSNAGAV
jgi:hypothetical protein